jgi:hypothetical protein
VAAAAAENGLGRGPELFGKEIGVRRDKVLVLVLCSRGGGINMLNLNFQRCFWSTTFAGTSL